MNFDFETIYFSSSNHSLNFSVSSLLIFCGIVAFSWFKYLMTNDFNGMMSDFLKRIYLFFSCRWKAASNCSRVFGNMFQEVWSAVPKLLTQWRVPGPVTTMSSFLWRNRLTGYPLSMNQSRSWYQRPSQIYKSILNSMLNFFYLWSALHEGFQHTLGLR